MVKQKHSQQGEFCVYPQDIIIALMGRTGTGKSSLIERLHGKNGSDLGISGHDLESFTSAVSAYRLNDHPLYGNRVVLVDTPGFNDTNGVTDLEVLKRIGDWLDKTYRQSNKETKLSGILYLHRITDNTYSGTVIQIQMMFERLCGRSAVEKVIVVTTMWEHLEDDEIGNQRLHILKSDYWRNMVRRGTRFEKFYGTEESANLILAKVVEREEYRRVLHLQKELVDLEMPLKETAAARTLRNTLEKGLIRQQQMLLKLENDEVGEHNPEVRRILAEERIKLQAELEGTLNDIRELKIGFFAKFLSLLGFKKA